MTPKQRVPHNYIAAYRRKTQEREGKRNAKTIFLRQGLFDPSILFFELLCLIQIAFAYVTFSARDMAAVASPNFKKQFPIGRIRATYTTLPQVISRWLLFTARW